MGKLWELIKMILALFGFGESDGSPTVPSQVNESSEEEGDNTVNSKPKKYALLVGLNKYALPNADLNGCVNDVNAMWEMLVNRYGFEADNIRTLIDERATKQAILERIHWLTEVASEGDILLYHHSGHGSHLRDRSGDELLDHEDECLISYDHDWDDPLLDDEIAKAFKKIPEGARLVFVCDTCLSGDTKIPLLDGTEKTIREMQEEGGEYWVYSSKENGEVVPGKAHSARIMGKKKLIRINLDNGEHLECTDDHLIMMRDGNYKKAGELKQGDSLMPLYRREWKETDSNYLKGYEFIRTTNPDSNRRKWIPTHIMVRDSFDMKQLGSEETVCHHKDYNKRNNTPENLEMMSWGSHKKAHSEVSKKNAKKLWQNEDYLAWRGSEEYKQKQSEIITESWKDKDVRKAHMIGVEKRIEREGRRYPKSFEQWNNSEENLKHLQQMSKDKEINKIRSEKSKDFWKSKEGQKEKQKLAQRNKLICHNRWHEARGIVKEGCEFCCPNNHKVVSVEQTDKVELVYDLTVDEYHNFAISSGVFVHNCHSGTMNRAFSEEPWKSRYYPAPLDIEFRSRDRLLPENKLGWIGLNKSLNDITRVEGQRHMLLSGCRDNQTSADAVFGGTWRGALTYTMMSVMQKYPKASWVDLHEHLVEQLKAKGFSQIPQLSGPSDLLDKAPFGGVSEE